MSAELAAPAPPAASPAPAAVPHAPAPVPVQAAPAAPGADAEEVELDDGTTQLVVPSDAPIVQRRNRILELMKTRSVMTAAMFQRRVSS